MSDLVVGAITQLTDHGGCSCICHGERDGIWRAHLCEHCAPRYARQHRDAERAHNLRQAGQGTDHPADHAEQGASGLTLGRQRSTQR